MEYMIRPGNFGPSHTMRFWRALLGIAGMALVAAHSAAQTTWQAEAPVALPAPTNSVIDQLTARFSAGSAGALVIRRATQPTAPAPQVLAKVQGGTTTQIAIIPLNTMAARFQDFAVFESLFLFKNLDAVEKYEASVDGRRLLESLEGSGLKGLGYLHGGMVQILSRKPLVATTDLKGLKLGAPLTDASARQFAALGMSAARLPAAETIVALERGVVDTTEAGWLELRATSGSSNLSVLETNHRYRGYVLVANNAAFDRLPSVARQQLLSDAQVIAERHNAAVKRTEGEARQAVVSRVRVAGLSRSDYDVSIGQLKRDGWSQVPGQQRAQARALAFSDEELARKHFANLAPDSPPPAAAPPPAPPPVAARPPPAMARPPAIALPPPAAALPPPVLARPPAAALPPPVLARPPAAVELPPAPPPAAAGPAAPTPTPPGAPAPPIVYNADLSPQLPRDQAAPSRPVLRAGQATVLRMDIGPKWATSILPDLTPAAEIVQSKDDVPLTVVMACGFCEPRADSLKRMTFRPGQGRSDEIRFQFTPQRRPGGTGYTEKLQLGIINDKTGREYDRLIVPVTVAGDGTASVAGGPGGAVALVPSKGVDRTDWRPDVLLYANEMMGSGVTVEIEPVSAEMKSLLGPLAFDAQGRRVFRSGIRDSELVAAMTNSAYGAMSAVSMQGALLKKLSATGTDAAVSKASQDSLELTPVESGNVAEVIAQSGQRLYRRLFSESRDDDLRTLITRLEAAAAAPRERPLRMMVVTDRLSLPWQYLHPVGPAIDGTRFWGMQFSLSVVRISNNAREKGVAPGMDQARKVVFARYGSSADPTVPLAEKQAAQLLLLPLAQADLLKVDTGADLLGKVSSQRKQIAGIVTFLHASAGSGDSVPELQFNEGDVVTSDSLENLLNKVVAEEQDLRYLAGAPLVILNACETGPSRQLPHVKLENAMFQLGARGVVVTEVSVWISLGHEVATRLIARLSRGEAVSDALTAVRRELQAEKRNPLGLLYAYYGDPAATLRR